MGQQAITQRVKFLIKHVIGTGVAGNQEELGRLLGVNNKSYFSQLVSGQRNNDNLINQLLNFVPNFNREWLYNESIENPFIETTAGTCLIESGKAPEDRIVELEHTIELLKRDVRYYADMADSRLQTIEVQTKLINVLVNK